MSGSRLLPQNRLPLGEHRLARGDRAVSGEDAPVFTLVQSDAIGLFAFDFVLLIILVRTVDVAFVVYVAPMHPYDTAADSARFRIPTYVIADLKHLSHLESFSFLPVALLSIRSRHCAPRHVHCRRE